MGVALACASLGRLKSGSTKGEQATNLDARGVSATPCHSTLWTLYFEAQAWRFAGSFCVPAVTALAFTALEKSGPGELRKGCGGACHALRDVEHGAGIRAQCRSRCSCGEAEWRTRTGRVETRRVGRSAARPEGRATTLGEGGGCVAGRLAKPRSRQPGQGDEDSRQQAHTQTRTRHRQAGPALSSSWTSVRISGQVLEEADSCRSEGDEAMRGYRLL